MQSKEYQFGIGENLQGFEIKYDKKNPQMNITLNIIPRETVEAGLEPTQPKKSFKDTPIAIALDYRNRNTALMLIESGLYEEAIAGEEETILKIAAARGYPEIAQVIVARLQELRGFNAQAGGK